MDEAKKGMCRYETKRYTNQRYCELNKQLLTGNPGNEFDTCFDCEDYEEVE